jgi:hypothetical protein
MVRYISLSENSEGVRFRCAHHHDRADNLIVRSGSCVVRNDPFVQAWIDDLMDSHERSMSIKWATEHLHSLSVGYQTFFERIDGSDSESESGDDMNGYQDREDYISAFLLATSVFGPAGN